MSRTTKQTLGWSRKVAASGIATACLLAAAACSSSGGGTASSSADSSSKAPVYLGGVLSLTGEFAGFEVPAYQGLEAGVAEVNAEGGVLGGRKLALDVVDDGSDATKVVAATQQVRSAHQVVFMAPDLVGDLGESVLKFTTQEKIITMSSGSLSAQDNPKSYPYNFSIYPEGSRQLAAYVAGAQQLAGGQLKLGILADTESADQALGAQIASDVKSSGGAVVSRISVPSDAQDLTVQARQAQQAGANVIIVLSIAGVCQATATAVNSIGWTSVKLLVTPACVSTQVFGAVPPAIAGNFYGLSDQITTRPNGSSSVRSQYASYVTQLQKYGAITDLEVSANYTDAVRMLAWAINKTGSTDGDKLKAALESLATTPLPASTTIWTASPGWSPANHAYLGDLSDWFALAQPGQTVEGTYPGVDLTVK
jgi:branched-chain amino acid transport system substrate-binding protein